MHEIRHQRCRDNQRRCEPVHGRGAYLVREDLICGGGGVGGAVEGEEGVPGEDAAPDEEVADPGEVGGDEGDLAVDGPDGAGVGGGAEVGDVRGGAAAVEGRGGEDGDGEGEEDEGGEDGVGDPAQDAFPAEAFVLLAVFVEGGKLRKRSVQLIVEKLYMKGIYG